MFQSVNESFFLDLQITQIHQFTNLVSILPSYDNFITVLKISSLFSLRNASILEAPSNLSNLSRSLAVDALTRAFTWLENKISINNLNCLQNKKGLFSTINQFILKKLHRKHLLMN